MYDYGNLMREHRKFLLIYLIIMILTWFDNRFTYLIINKT